MKPDRKLVTEVQEFLDRFARALTSGDGHAAAALWETPALVLGDDVARAVGSPAEVEQFFGGAKAQYNARGIFGTRAEIRGLEALTANLVLVTVRWPQLGAGGGEVGEEVSTYALRRDDADGLRIRVAMMQGEG
jgi:hypothetical protein